MIRKRKSNSHPEDSFLIERGNELYYGKPDRILCSDMHLREDTPKCWIGDFQTEQWLMVTYLSKLQEQYKCPVIHAGDLFDYWKPSPWLIAQAIDLLPKEFYTIYGQHDLPQHNWELRGKSGLNALRVAKIVNLLSGYHYGQQIYTGASRDSRFHKMLVWHHMTYINPPFPDAKPDGQALQILKRFPQFDLIVTGDNHQSFSVKYQGRLLVNPGCMTRQEASLIDFQPRIALWYAKTNSIKWVYLPIQENAISREHIEEKQRKDKRITAFVKSLDTEWETEESFEKNLEIFKNKNRIRKSVSVIINKSLETQK